jgi:CelD/BcsL family acetyltransferase involved in cellulose biosynthesis
MVTSNDRTTSNLVWDVQPLTTILEKWAEQADQLHGSTTQQIAWVSHWQNQVNPDCICVVAHSNEQLRFVLTLEVIKQGPLKIAAFPGGRHANENFASVSSNFNAGTPLECVAAVKAQIREKRPDIDAIYLHRQVQKLNGMTNPVLSVETSTPTDIALSFATNSDFQEVLQARDGMRKQKKIRKASRRLDERGGWTYQIISNADEAQTALSRFYTLKAHRLAGKGIANVFETVQVQAFFNALFAQSITIGSNEFEMHILKVGGEIVAVTGNSRNGERINVEFTAVDDTDPGVSHGEFLYFHMICNACERGIKTFSFGVGDEPFKRSWCNIETAQYNTAIALTWKGAFAANVESLKTNLKRWVKSNKRLYQWLKTMRKPAKKSIAPSSDKT